LRLDEHAGEDCVDAPQPLARGAHLEQGTRDVRDGGLGRTGERHRGALDGALGMDEGHGASGRAGGRRIGPRFEQLLQVRHAHEQAIPDKAGSHLPPTRRKPDRVRGQVEFRPRLCRLGVAFRHLATVHRLHLLLREGRPDCRLRLRGWGGGGAEVWQPRSRRPR